MVLKIKFLFFSFWYLPLIIFFNKAANKPIIIEDIEEWCKNMGYKDKSITNKLIYLLFISKTFRNLFYFRIPRIPKILQRFICRKDPLFNITPYNENGFNDIEGGGLYVITGHSIGTRITARKIGKGCKFRQLTTIGTKGIDKFFECPTIGRNVVFGTNVTCIGDITIGDNAIIGAGAVVVKSVPPNAIVAGNPAKIIGWNNPSPSPLYKLL